MTPRQERFVQEYLIDLNATRAAIRAGYSPGRADNTGSLLLKNPEVAEAVQAAKQERAEEAKIDQRYVVDNLVEIVERCMQRAPVMARGTQVTDSEGAHVWSFDARGASSALNMLAKHLGMLTDKVQMDVTLSPAAIMEKVRERRGTDDGP